MNSLPKRLKKEPLIEVIWQAQLDDSQGVGDVLPGILFNELKKSGRNLKLHRLPSADIPASIAQIDPNLRFVPKMLMEELGSAFIWQVGDRVIALNCRKPYVGWDKFKETVVTLTRIIENSQIIPIPQRHSLRYIDLLRGELAADLSALKLTLKLGDCEIGERIQMRLEIQDVQCVHILQIATSALVSLVGERLTGIIIDLETLPADVPNSWDTIRKQLDLLHDRSKQLFFGQILTAEAIQNLAPEY